jgi:hypothetical protein
MSILRERYRCKECTWVFNNHWIQCPRCGGFNSLKRIWMKQSRWVVQYWWQRFKFWGRAILRTNASTEITRCGVCPFFTIHNVKYPKTWCLRLNCPVNHNTKPLELACPIETKAQRHGRMARESIQENIRGFMQLVFGEKCAWCHRPINDTDDLVTAAAGNRLHRQCQKDAMDLLDFDLRGIPKK